MTDDDFRRLEAKVDRLTDAVSKLILFEERQAMQGIRIGECEKSVALLEHSTQKVEKKVDQWVNRGLGAWALALVMFAAVQFGARIMGVGK